jgi:protoporphyrin/coproporphyrin ferrochelatase
MVSYVVFHASRAAAARRLPRWAVPVAVPSNEATAGILRSTEVLVTAYDAFLLVSFGGPEGPDDVMPFLENVTRGRGIPPERLEEVSHHYLALGGISPINAQNRALVAALRNEFEARGIGLPIYWGNRNWDPYLTPEIERIHADGHRRVLAIATSAYSSYSGCRQYREDLARSLEEAGLVGKLAIDKVRHYFDHPGFVQPFAEGLTAALAGLAQEGFTREDVHVFFTTHSIPNAMAETSGPPGFFDANGAYVAQHLAAIECVLAGVRAGGVETPGWSLVYQSRSGSPEVPWLEPDINDAIRDAHARRVRAAVVVPIGFVSDHVEVVWDLDHEARETCDELGVRMVRVPTPGTHPAFVAAIADLVLERAGTAPAVALSSLGPWPGICAADCCRNLRRDLPTVAGLDSTAGHLARG